MKRIRLSVALSRYLLWALAFIAVPTFVSGQGRKVREFSIQPVRRVALDRLGNLYVLTQDGALRKYDTDGNFLDEFAGGEAKDMTLLDPWNPLRVFTYSRLRQEITILDHHLSILEKTPLDASLTAKPALASPLANGNLWVLDGGDYSLKKMDVKTNGILQDINRKLPSVPTRNYTYLREYQNQLFLIDVNSGIEILSVTGKPIRSFPVKNLMYLGFLGRELYYLDGGKIKLFDLYTEDQRELAADPLAEVVLLTDERMIVVKKTSVEVWEFTP